MGKRPEINNVDWAMLHKFLEDLIDLADEAEECGFPPKERDVKP